MDRNKTQDSFSSAIIHRFSAFHLSIENWAAHSFQTANWEVGIAVKDAFRMLKIITFLHSAQDLQSVLRLYGLEESHAGQNSSEM